MADLTRTAAKVAAVFRTESLVLDIETSVTVGAGEAVAIGTDGKLDLADGSTGGNALATRGIALRDGVAGDVIPVLIRGGLEGFDVSSIDGDAPVYVSGANTGELADGAGAVSKIVGTVFLIPGTSDKIIWIDVPWAN